MGWEDYFPVIMVQRSEFKLQGCTKSGVYRGFEHRGLCLINHIQATLQFETTGVVMHELENQILSDAMQSYFHHRDLAIGYQAEFNAAQKSFVKDLLAEGRTRDEIRAAVADFTKSSQCHDDIIRSIKDAAMALRLAHCWCNRQKMKAANVIEVAQFV